MLSSPCLPIAKRDNRSVAGPIGPVGQHNLFASIRSIAGPSHIRRGTQPQNVHPYLFYLLAPLNLDLVEYGIGTRLPAHVTSPTRPVLCRYVRTYEETWIIYVQLACSRLPNLCRLGLAVKPNDVL